MASRNSWRVNQGSLEGKRADGVASQRARQFVGRRRQCRATRLPDLAIMAPGVFGRYVAPEWGCLAVGGASLCVSAFSNAFAPKAMGRVVDAYAKRSKDGGAGLRVELRRTACVFAVGALASGVRVSCFSRALQKALRRLRADVFDAALRRKASFFVLGESSGDDRLDADAVATAVERDASVALAVCTEQLQNAFRYASSLLNGGSQLFALCPGLAGELLTCVPVLAVLVRGASKSVAKRGAGAEHAEKALAVKARDLARSDRAHSVKLAGGDAVEAARFAELADAARDAGVAHGVARGALQGVLDVVGKLTVLGVVFRGGHRVERGDLSGGDLLAFALYAGYASLGLAGLAKFAASEMKAGKRAAKACLRVLALADVDAASAALLDGAADAGGVGVTPDHLVLDDVTFGYSSSSPPVLRNCSLRVARGTSHALVGASGAGKSSILRLLLRLYDADSGVVRVDGADVAAMAPGDLAGLRKARAAVVEQVPTRRPSSLFCSIRARGDERHKITPFLQNQSDEYPKDNTKICTDRRDLRTPPLASAARAPCSRAALFLGVAPAVVRVARRRRRHVRRSSGRRRRRRGRGGGRGRRRLHPRARRGLPRGDRRHGRPPQRRPAEPAVGRARARARFGDVLAPRRAHGRARRQDRGRSPRQRPRSGEGARRDRAPRRPLEGRGGQV